VDPTQFLSVLLGLFVTVDPVGSLPLIAVLTRRLSAEERRATVRRAVWIAFLLLVAFAVAGSAVLGRLGIGLPAVQIAGGVLLFGIGLEMLYGRVTGTQTTAPEEQEAATKEDISVTPLAIPMLAGPGSIAAVLLLTPAGSGWRGQAVVLAALALVFGASWLILAFSEVVLRGLGGIGLRVVTRVMGLLLLFLSAQRVIDGLTALGLIAPRAPTIG
jgi:multiple antibiotic resistance protein